jgi:methylenetetrahydrofolate--tRNA-(uracil-5-)-methyltransferase
MRIHIVGGGLAGSEAAWQCLRQGLSVTLYEMRPQLMTPAHKTGDLAELVCSNTFKSMREGSAPAILKHEMRSFDSLIMRCAEQAAIPAGQALGVDRQVFSHLVTEELNRHPQFERLNKEVEAIPSIAQMGNDCWIIATGPLSSERILPELARLSGQTDRLYFYDAIAPIIAADTIDFEHCFFANRYDEESDDYLNIPLSKEEYEILVADINAAEKSPLHKFEETKYFECCLPVEVMAERGVDTLRFGPLKPVGFTDPKTGRRPWAVIQLRRENKATTMYSMVGFQTKMKWPEQARVFAKIPALREAEFLRFGSVHRNTYLKSPQTLNEDLSFRSNSRVYLAGQITGVEGYSESAAMGLLAGRFATAKAKQQQFALPPKDTMIGALLDYVTHGTAGPFTPMNCNMGLLPAMPKTRGVSKTDRRLKQYQAAIAKFDAYFDNHRLGLQ